MGIVAMKVFLLLALGASQINGQRSTPDGMAVAVDWALATAWAEDLDMAWVGLDTVDGEWVEGLDLVEAGVENAAQPRKFGDWERRMESMTSSWTVTWWRL